jgi:molybdopterin/thiamine biosynthesis adenylyltransferase
MNQNGSVATVAAHGPISGTPSFSYQEAFGRHLGLFNPEEQKRLRSSRVAIAGMGGVGGIHLITLARLGIGAFHIADPDHFELANFNRQYGATLRTLGEPKAEVMAEEARAVNPELRLRVFSEAITTRNVSEMLDGVDVLVDGIDFFSIDARRRLFREARRRGLWAITAGPIGFSAAWLVFSPTGMSFDEYFDLNDSMDQADQLVAFLVGLTPRATQRAYLDLTQVDPRTCKGPSAGLACHLCSGVVAAEVVKILLGRSPIRSAPYYFQFDAYRQKLCKGRLLWGNRHPWQRVKRVILRSHLARMGWDAPGTLLSEK